MLNYWGNERIDPDADKEASHVPLTCVNHPNLRWMTKNIGFIGARTIFFNGEIGEDGKLSPEPALMVKTRVDGEKYVGYRDECACSIKDLRVVKGEKIEWR